MKKNGHIRDSPGISPKARHTHSVEKRRKKRDRKCMREKRNNKRKLTENRLGKDKIS